MNSFLLASEAGGISFIVLLTLLTITVFAAFVWLLCLGLKGTSLKLKLKPKHIFYIVLALGAVVRIAIALTMSGLMGTLSSSSFNRTGYNGIVYMTDNLITNGFDRFLERYELIIFYPITMYILSFFGSVSTLFGHMEVTSEITLIFMKLPFIISDVLLALTVYKIAAKFSGELVALSAGGFVALCPVFMLSSIWPSIYTFLALAIVIMLYFMLQRKYVLLIITYAFSLLICFEAVYLLPIVAVFIIYAYVKKVIAFRNSGYKGAIWNSEYGMIAKVPVTILICLACSYLLTLPFALSYVGADPFAMLYVYYLKPFDNFGYFTFNGLSLYNIFGKNGEILNLSFPTFVFSLLFAVAIIAVTLIVYLTKKNRANLVMLASYLLLTINVYFANSFELTLLPFLAVTLIAFLVVKDKRLLQIIGIIALFVFLNAAGVLIKAEYFGLYAEYTKELLDQSWAVLSIVASVVVVLTHIYYTVVLLDVVMNGRIKKLSATDDRFVSSLKSLIKIKD